MHPRLLRFYYRLGLGGELGAHSGDGFILALFKAQSIGFVTASYGTFRLLPKVFNLHGSLGF